MPDPLTKISILFLAGLIASTLVITAYLHYPRNKPIHIFCPSLLLIIYFGGALYAYFLPGDIIPFDGGSHIARTWLYTDILKKRGVAYLDQ